MKVYDTLDLHAADAVVGKHSVWVPKLNAKVPFQWGGRLQKYSCPGETAYPLTLLGEEVALLRALAARGEAPPIGDWVYFKTVLSEHPGAWWADPCGAYGYEMADAQTLAPGRFTVEGLQASGLVEGSPGAWNDLRKPGNVVNGYVVDVRRSGWDRLRWTGPPARCPAYTEDPDALTQALHRDGPYPFRERPLPYQEYYLDTHTPAPAGGWHAAERAVIRRARQLRFRPVGAETVVDLGCHVGGFLQYAALHSLDSMAPTRALRVGVDAQAHYVDLGRRLARAAGWNLCLRRLDVEQDAGLLTAWLRALFPAGPDHLLLLSMVKHLRGGEPALWALVDALRARWTYLETNAIKSPDTDWPLRDEAVRRGGAYLGDSDDRHRRRLYRVPGPV